MATSKRFIAKNGLDNNNQTILNVASPVNATDAATKSFSSNASNLSSGTIASTILGNSTVYLGTTAIALNRASASQALTGITSIDGSSAQVISETGSVTKIAYPETASLSGGSGLTGAIKITLPASWTNTMMAFEVTIYNYATDDTYKLILGGYNYAPTTLWSNTSAQCLGGSGLRVRFGHDGTNCAIYIGETTATWNYVKVVVSNFVAGYTNYAASSWQTGWSVALTSTIGTITSDFSATQTLIAAGTVTGSVSASVLTGTIPSTVLGNSTLYVGTTAIALNRASAVQTLTGVSVDGNAATATTASQLGGISSSRTVQKRRSRIHSADGTSLNSSITAPEMGFTYGGSGEPSGPFIAFGGLFGDIDFSCQLVGQYNAGGNQFVIRTRNDDPSTLAWNAWRTILTDGNYTSYSPSLTGSGASGTWGINITGSSSSCTGNAASATSCPNYLPLTGGTLSGNLTGVNYYLSSAGTERQIRWQQTGRDVYIYNRDSDKMMGVYDTVSGGRWTADVSGNFVAVGNVTAYSDPKLKENVEKISNPLSILKSIDGCTFNWKDGIETIKVKAGKRDYGIMADQVQLVMPEIVAEMVSYDDEIYKTVAYEKLVPVLIEAIKQLEQRIKDLESK